MYLDIQAKSKPPKPPSLREHYYGDIERRFLILACLLMVVLFPYFRELIIFPVYFSLLAMFFIILVAGLITPARKWTMIANTFVSIGAFIFFEYVAVISFGEALSQKEKLYYWINQGLSIIFLIASYYNIKTVRGALFHDSDANLAEKK